MHLSVACGLLGAAAVRYGQTTASGPYYAVPSWDQTRAASSRFVVRSKITWKDLMKTALVALGCLVVATGAHADPITLNFEGIANYPFLNRSILINDYYNGGTASNGRSGTNYGVSFSQGARLECLNTLVAECSAVSKGGMGVQGSQYSAMYFPTINPIMDVVAGFTTGFSMAYSDPFGEAAGIEIWSGLDATGTLLASSALARTTNGTDGACTGYGVLESYPAVYCPFANFSLAFDGTAESVVSRAGPVSRCTTTSP